MKLTILALFAAIQALAVDVHLLDSRSGSPIANADITVFSDNGIRCIKAPCPTNAKQWKGHSDGSGHVVVPDSAFQSDTRFEVKGYQPSDPVPSKAATASRWTVKLEPQAR